MTRSYRKYSLSVLRKIRDSIPIEALLKVYHGMPLSNRTLTIVLLCAWNNKGLRDKLQRLQNRAGRIITDSGYEIRSAEIMKNLGWKTLEHRWDINKAVLMFKVVNNAGTKCMITMSV